MTTVHAEHKCGSAKDRAEVAKWDKYYAMASRRKAFFLFVTPPTREDIAHCTFVIVPS